MLMLPAGITVLEEHLIQCAVDPQPSKRSRGEKTTIFTDVALWIELARCVQVVYLYFVDWGGQVCTGSLFVLCGLSWPGVYRCTGS